MQRTIGKFARAATFAALVPVLGAVLGACSSDIGLSNINILPKTSDVVRPDWMSFSGHREEFSLRPAGPEDLVGPEGQCASAAPDPSQDPSGEGAATPALLSGGIALQMTECDVVRRAGAPERVEFGSSERGERAVVLTYVRGPRPGVYRFASGRL